jgi:hypothetical protein
MGAVNTTYTFTATDTVTSGKLNNIIDQTIMTDDAVFTGGTVEVAGGKLKVRSGSITSNELASSSVVTAKIVNEAVITEKISDSAITTIKLANSTNSTTGVTTAKIADSNVTTAKLADASVVAGKLSGAQTGSAPIYGIRAWVKFAGSNAAITASGNVSSVVRNSAGIYTITMTTAMPDVNYVVMGTVQRESATTRGGLLDIESTFTKTTTQVKVRTIHVSSDPSPGDCASVYVAVIR